MFITVTTVENFIEYEDGTFECKDPAIIGRLKKIHNVQVHQIDPETKALVTGIKVLGEVYWEHDRRIAGVLTEVDNLVWLNFESQEAEQESDEEESQDEPDNEFDDDSEELDNFN